jgi:putative FmdB family regulatory protein
VPLYEYYCEPCHGIFEEIRQMREAGLPMPCPECNSDAPRIMSSFNAFVFRDGYPRRLPDKGTYWHMGQEVKKRAKRMKGNVHPELAKPKSTPKKTRGDVAVELDKKRTQRADAIYRSRWGVDKYGLKTVKEKKPKPARKTLPAG